MDIYNYVAGTNPQGAKQIIESFGYKVKNRHNMGGNLKELVKNEGEPALKMILDNHPDKDVILEVFSPIKEGKHYQCQCDACKEKRLIDKFISANGNPPTEAKKIDDNFSIVFLAGVVALSIAIMSKK